MRTWLAKKEFNGEDISWWWASEIIDGKRVLGTGKTEKQAIASLRLQLLEHSFEKYYGETNTL